MWFHVAITEVPMKNSDLRINIEHSSRYDMSQSKHYGRKISITNQVTLLFIDDFSSRGPANHTL